MPDAVNEPLLIDPQHAEQIKGWLETRGGVLVWRSANLSNPGASWTGPYLDAEGNPSTQPTWEAESKPSRHVSDPKLVFVQTCKEVKRFRVAIRGTGFMGANFKVTDAGSRRIRNEVDKANKASGKEAWHTFDYETQEAVIMVEDKRIPLEEFTTTQHNS